jgi:pSer/pThr/pTyr-binding forkhead associated (FHA) protein
MLKNGIRAQGTIVLKVAVDDESGPEDQASFTIDAPGVEGYILGRSDESSSYQPDIDLAPFDAQRKGISRRHAVLLRYRGVLHVLDLGSVNGTFVNGERLVADVPQPLRAGDELRLAGLALFIAQ